MLSLHADEAEQEFVALSLAQQRGTDSSTSDQPSHVVRTLAPNGQPRKLLASSGTSAASPPADDSIGTRPASIVGAQREIHRTASNGQPRKGLSLTRPADGQGMLKNNSFRNR